MAYFVVHSLDKPDMGALRARVRDAHRARLRQHDHLVAVRIGGPLLDDVGAMIGSMLVIEAADKAAVESFLAGDPYVLGGLYDTVRVVPFQWGLGQPQESAHG